jgi:hypothetical protein
VILGIRALERLGGRQGSMFDIDLQPILGFPGRIIDFVQFVNSTVIVTLLILAVPLYFLMRDIRAAVVRYGIGTGERLHLEKDASTSRRPGESSPRTRRSRCSCTGTPTFHPCARSTDGTSSTREAG